MHAFSMHVNPLCRYYVYTLCADDTYIYIYIYIYIHTYLEATPWVVYGLGVVSLITELSLLNHQWCQYFANRSCKEHNIPKPEPQTLSPKNP